MVKDKVDANVRGLPEERVGGTLPPDHQHFAWVIEGGAKKVIEDYGRLYGCRAWSFFFFF